MSVFYLFQETTIGGEACGKPQFLTASELRAELFRRQIDRATINHAIAICNASPNVPYDICAHHDEEIVWTARITLLQPPKPTLVN